MKILYLTFYYEPDLCAGSFRNTPLARELSKLVTGPDAQVTVVTTQPNRYSSYNMRAPEIEKADNLVIHRVNVSKHKSGFIDQMLSFRSYYFAALQIAKKESFDLVFASSSRLFTAYLGYKIAKKRKVPLYLDIRDLFTDTMRDLLSFPVLKNPVLYYLKYLEKRIFNYADHINLISGGFNQHVMKYNVKNISNFSHGVDVGFVAQVRDKKVDPGSFVITYAGNLGDGQGLHKIIPAAAILLEDKYRFRIIGDGGQINKLRESIERDNLSNVSLEKPVSREKLINIYSESDYFLIHLNDYDAFKKVLPSKIFELGALNRPIIAGVSGYAKDFMSANLTNIILFEPGNVCEMVRGIRSFKYNTIERAEFIQKFNRETINREMAASVLSYIK